MKPWGMLAAAVLLTAACSSTTGASGKPAGCYDLGQAITQYSDLLDGVKNGTVTNDDAASKLAKVAKKLDDASDPSPAGYQSGIADAELAAGQLRVQIVNGTAADNTLANAVADGMDSAYTFCK